MANKELISELLDVQALFDERIATKNVEDSTLAYMVEIFEWINARESFKNWKTNPGKGYDVELSELADVLAFALSVFNQVSAEYAEAKEGMLDSVMLGINELFDIDMFETSVSTLGFVNVLTSEIYREDGSGHTNESIALMVATPFIIANHYYTEDELVGAYKTKMEVNHARQDGTVDTDKGYV